MVQLYVNEAMLRLGNYARQLAATLESGDSLITHLSKINNALQYMPLNSVQLRRAIADEIIFSGKYTC